MIYWLLFAVVITTAFIVSIIFKIKQRELSKTQELLLQFIDQFEEQYQLLSAKVEEQNAKLEKKYAVILHLIKSPETDALLMSEESSDNAPIDPLHLHDRFQPIVTMIQEGKSIEEIARSTGKGKGEISLILELMKTEISVIE